MTRNDVDRSASLDSADRGIDHAPAWTLQPGWHVRTERMAATRDYHTQDADYLQDGPPAPWEDPDFEVTGFTGWNNDTCQG